MGELLPDGSIQGYTGICPKCKKFISTNIQGNEIGNHKCEERPDFEIPEWIVKYDKQNYQSSAGKAVRALVEKVALSRKRIEELEAALSRIANCSDLATAQEYARVARLIPEAKPEYIPGQFIEELFKNIPKGKYDQHYKGTAPIVEESQAVKIEVNKNAIPRKAKLVEAYETDHQIIIMFGKEEIPESHSCDDMGCGSFSHVKYILTKP